MKRRVVVVDGPLAFHMRRLEAARAGHTGLEVMTLPQLAARLVGGFCRVADRAVLSPAASAALNQGGFSEIENVRSLPGMVRAVLQTLNRVWAADIQALASQSARVRDLCLIQQRVRAALPDGVKLPRDVRDTAIAYCRLSPALLGSVTLEGLSDVDHLWRPLLIALTAHIDVVWKASGDAERPWFPGAITVARRKPRGTIEGDLCADPRAEIVESLRWAREILSRGDVNAADIAIATASPATYDDHMLALARDSDLPIPFSHGIPALSTWEGQLLRAWLVGCQTGAARLRAGMPASWTVGDKTGTNDHGTSNDVAIVWPLGRPPLRVVAYLTESPLSSDERDAILADVARVVTAQVGA